MGNPFRKLSFEYKILGAFFLTLLVGISALNVVAINSYKVELMKDLREEVELRLMLFREEKVPLPPYLLLSDKPLAGNGWVLYSASYDGKFVLLDISPVRKKLKDFTFAVFLWEGALVLGLSYLLYRLLGRYLREKERTREFLELLLLALSHRLGNFLAAQRVNLEILKQRPSGDVIMRLEEAYNHIEDQFRRTMELVRLLPEGEEETEVDLKEVVEKTLEPFKGALKGKDLKLELFPLRIAFPPTVLEMAIQPLIENAAKYSNRWVRITLKKDEGIPMLVIENDIGDAEVTGSGLGLELARKIGRGLGIVIETKGRGGIYQQVVKFPWRRQSFTIS